MENGTLVMADTHSVRLRVSSVIVALALVFAASVLVQHRAEAAPGASGAVASALAVPSASAVAPQIGIGGQFVCSILISIRAAFANSPFFAFIAAILNSLIIGFGCNISVGAG